MEQLLTKFFQWYGFRPVLATAPIESPGTQMTLGGTRWLCESPGRAYLRGGEM